MLLTCTTWIISSFLFIFHHYITNVVISIHFLSSFFLIICTTLFRSHTLWSQEALGYIRKELAHGTGVLLNWKKNCDSGAVLAIAALIAEFWLASLFRGAFHFFCIQSSNIFEYLYRYNWNFEYRSTCLVAALKCERPPSICILSFEEEGVDLDEAQKRVNGLHPCARKDETQTKLRQLFSQSSHSDLWTVVNGCELLWILWVILRVSRQRANEVSCINARQFHSDFQKKWSVFHRC